MNPSALSYYLFFGGFSSVMRWRWFIRLKSTFTTRSNVFSLGGLNVSSRLCICMCVSLFYSMYRNYNDTSMRCTSSLIRNVLASSHRALSLSHSIARSLVVTTLVLCVHFLCLKISRSFLEKAFFLLRLGLQFVKF